MSHPAGLRLAIDMMSGDAGLTVTMPACRSVLESEPGLELLACGDPAAMSQQLQSWPSALAQRLEIIEADSVLAADAGAAQALRRGSDSSLGRSLQLLANGHAVATVSAAGTGAMMVLSRHLLGMLPGIDRPALMAAIPTPTGSVWLLDLGANINVDARRLCEFAHLGHVALSVLSGSTPTIGLLNIGTEPGKGPDVLREAARLIEASTALDYRGFVEADQVFAGVVDLVVFDGFAGNILLKSAEGAVGLMFAELKKRFAGSLCGLLAKSRLASLHDSLDPARHNGAPLLGLRGTVIKSHGGTSAAGFAHAIRLAMQETRRGVAGAMESQLWAAD